LSWPRRGAGSCRRECRRTCGRAVVGVPLAGALIAAILSLGLHVNLSLSAPRWLYRASTGTPTRGAWVAARVSTEAAASDVLEAISGPTRA